jgi:hypothetical protein
MPAQKGVDGKIVAEHNTREKVGPTGFWEEVLTT